MKCKHCGNEIADGSKFCKRCGNKVTHANHRLFFFVLFALLLVGGCIGVYYGIKNSKVPVGKVTITVDTNDSTMGTVNGGGECARYDTITIEAVANMNYRFVSWDDGCEDRIRQVVADHDKKYLAQFEVIPSVSPSPVTSTVSKFRISVKSSDETMGTVKGEDTYDSLTIVTIEALAKEGYHFISWNDGNTDSSRNVVADHNQEFMAFFEPNSYPTTKFKITVKSSDPQRGTVTEGGAFDSLTIITIKAMPKEGYEFASWNDGNKENPRTIKVTANQRFVAMFKEKPSVTPSPTPEPSDIKVDWNGVATYTGPGLGSQPDGFGGKLVFYKDYQLDLKKIDGRKLDIKAGEIIEPTKFKDGKLNIIGIGTLHRKDGTTHPIM